ncbi:sulfur reduction protein DsrE [Antarcticibacterium arcticum]|uniref:Sulfur reduction protein DsrE n=1 Tax=Antarcticibacterium arcticum TaxID=2585771 RepID=A0A5B8YFA4_9FLAO|nr:DsrE family protein [Antarcticibacterium arcticum]QED36610.1 sulfur reduction protein DsrE [Antarcticibacterium arcticum]
MKTLFLSSLAFVLMLITNPVNAQETINTQNNYVVLTKKVDQLKPIILTARSLKEEDGENFGDYQAIICGQDITLLTDKEKMKDFLTEAKEAGVKLIACGFSMKKFGVDAGEIPAEFEVVENGILYNFQLQKKGYYSLGL